MCRSLHKIRVIDLKLRRDFHRFDLWGLFEIENYEKKEDGVKFYKGEVSYLNEKAAGKSLIAGINVPNHI